MRDRTESATLAGPGPAPGPVAARAIGRGGRWWVRAPGFALDVLVVLLVGLYFLADLRLARTDAVADHPLRPTPGPGQDWLLLGSGRPEPAGANAPGGPAGAAAGRRIDMMLLLHIPRSGGRPTLITLPRETYTLVRGHGRITLDKAFQLGGSRLLVASVESAIGVRVDRFMELPSDAPARALGNAERPERRREFVTALMDRATGMGALLNPLRDAPPFGSAGRTVTVDESDHMHHLIRLALAMRRVRDGDVVTATLPVQQSMSLARVGPVLLLDDGKIHELAAAIATDHPLPASLLTD